MENFLLVILTIPLADQSLIMNMHRVHNLSALHPKLHVQFQYQLEGEYLAITKDETLTRHVFFLEFNDEYQRLNQILTNSTICCSPYCSRHKNIPSVCIQILY